MLFNSWPFLFFFVTVFLLYNCLRLRAQNVLLLVASYFFYGWWDWRFLSLLMISTAVDYTVARMMTGTEGRRRKLLLAVSVCTNVGLLGFFKYCNFFLESASALLTALGFAPHTHALRIILPVGISFYTFQTMAYAIDVYRKRFTAVRDPVTFALYVSFFPQLVAGPIERPGRLLPQLTKSRQVTREKVCSGCVLVLIGLVRKMAIADVVAGRVDTVFGDPGRFGSLAMASATVLFALQIYCDFAGYSDIARGVSRILGIELIRNFEHPYLATNLTEFWHRWHISLSTWLRDYVYIPLGGNRCARLLTYRNILVTMLLGGLWHGAQWTFVAWGGIHGLALVVHKIWRSRAGEAPGTRRMMVRLLCWALTMLFVCLAWIFFRSQDFGTAFQALSSLLSFRGGIDLKCLALPAAMIAFVLFLDVPQVLTNDHAALLRWPLALRTAVYAALVLVLIALPTGGGAPFIYFQF